MPQKTLLVISSIYPPDVAAVGQYLADAAEEMARRGWRVVVLTANRGYDDPSERYTSREVVNGVQVIRLPLSSFGKRSIAIRMMGGLSFVVQSVLRSIGMRRIDLVLISTTPPLSPLAALALRVIRRTPIVYWIMDLNPDQFVALGHAKPDAMVVRVFDAMNRRILRAARKVIVLDRFMAERINRKVDVSEKTTVLPPWSRDNHLQPVGHDINPFRERHGLIGKFVVMYSGNHGPSNPLTTLLDAARRLREDDRIIFVFIGGGVGKWEVDETARDHANVLSLPYQPLEDLSYSLSAADIHAVTMGDEVVGIVHPSKVYGAFAVERPVLFIGPLRSHVGEILEQHPVGWKAAHGDVDRVVEHLVTLVDGPREVVSAAGRDAKRASDGSFGAAALCGEFCDLLAEAAST